MQRSLSHHFLTLTRRSAWLVFFLWTLAGVCLARPRKDVVQFANGDRITCEIIKLEKGYLYIKLDYADGTVAIDWSKISRVDSTQDFFVTDKRENRYTGSLQSEAAETASEGVKIQVTGPVSSQTLAREEVVGIGPTDTGFWQNLHGGADIGLNYSKQQNRTQYNFDSNAAYQRTKWSTSANYTSSFSGGGGISDLRNDLQLNYVRQLRSPRNFYAGLGGFQQSTEQELDLRTTFGGALGHVFSYTNNSLIAAYGGVVWTREHYSSTATVEPADSAEAILGSQLNFFRFKTTNILVDARLYPSLTDSGRTRFDLNTTLKLRIARNLYWNFSYYLNVDSRPPQAVSKTDYGTTSGLGWTF